MRKKLSTATFHPTYNTSVLKPEVEFHLTNHVGHMLVLVRQRIEHTTLDFVQVTLLGAMLTLEFFAAVDTLRNMIERKLIPNISNMKKLIVGRSKLYVVNTNKTAVLRKSKTSNLCFDFKQFIPKYLGFL
jgi:hypothetical protein